MSVTAKQARAIWPSLKLADWPETDRAALEANTVKGRRNRRSTPGGHYAEASLQKFAKGYARWLGFLQHRGWLDTGVPAGERVTGERLNDYFNALRSAGNADNTVVGRFEELSRALAILEPTHDWRWVRGPEGGVIPRRLRTRRALVVPHPRVLYRWGCGLMDKAHTVGSKLAGALQFRDGLIIAMEAARARRLRSMAGLLVGTELARQPDGLWRLALLPARVKTGKADSFTLPAHLSPYIDRYLGEIRPFLLRERERESSAMWIGKDGQVLAKKSFGENYGQRARKRFKVRFGPHRNRHAIVTAAAIDAPFDPTLGARVIRITVQVADDHYRRAGQANAAKAYNNLVGQLQGEAVARLGYRRQPRLRPTA